MTPEEHIAQQTRIEHKLDVLTVQNTRIETYQKTHYRKLEDHDDAIEKISLRVGKNEKIIVRAGGGLSAVVFLMGAYIADFFKGGS